MRHALIVGGTRGLGREVLKLLSAEGCKCSVIGRREPLESDKAIPNCKHWIYDLSSGKNIKNLVAEINNSVGAINHLVFCQRYRGTGDSWQGEIDISLALTKEIIEASLGIFKSGEDNSIVFVSSVLGEFIGEGQDISYHVSKAGMNQMMRYYAVNLGRRGIRVNAVTPFTFLKEESQEFYLKNMQLYDLYKKIVPLSRLGKAEETAKVISFLCGPGASFVNGQNIFVDGGLSLVWPEALARGLLEV